MTATPVEAGPVVAGRSPVLVVDDDHAIRSLVTRVLQRASYDVDQAANGQEALTHLRAKNYAAVVLDLMMPVMSGFELVGYLSTHDDAGAPCIVIVSAAAGRDLAKLDSPLVQAILHKPFDLPALLDVVAQCTSKYP